MTAAYIEIDPFPAETLRRLIASDMIAPGVVFECPIEDITPNELAQYTQVHAFAGIGIWSLALRMAGVSDDYPVWTASAPCQPFSVAGKGAGFVDERHVWPAFHWLAQQCRPKLILGEQVKNGSWIDLAQADMEGLGYAFGCTALAACGTGAPFVGDRAYWVAASDWNEQSRQEPRRWEIGRMGRFIEPVSQDTPWPTALAEFRVLDDGHSRCVGATDALRNGMHAPTVAAFIEAVMDVVHKPHVHDVAPNAAYFYNGCE